MVVVGEDGLSSFTPPPVSTYRGEVVDYPGSLVSASLVDGQLSGMLRLAEDLPWIGIQPVSEYDASAPRDLHWVYEAEDAMVPNVGCGALHAYAEDHDHDHSHHPAGGGGTIAFGSSTVEAEIAIDADVEFYQLNQSTVLNTEVDIEKVISGVSAIYESQFGLSYRITHIIVRTAENDPYSSTNASTLLNQLRNHWTSSQGSIVRDQTHLFTGKELNGTTIGVANLNSICGNNNGYGLSQSRFTGGITSRIALTAHELGHNWAATHCNGSSTCSIMCDALGGCTGNITSFGTSASNQINNKINSSGCIDPPVPGEAPQLDSVNVASIGAFKDGSMTLSGEDLITATEVRVGNSVVPPTNLEIGYSELRITDGIFAEAGSQEIEVTTPAGTAGGVFVNVLEETAIQLEAPLISIPGEPFNLSWSGGGNNFYFIVIAPNGFTVPFQGSDILVNGNVVLSGTLGSGGADSFVDPDPGSFPLLTLFFQLWIVDAGSLQFEGASDVTATLFL